MHSTHDYIPPADKSRTVKANIFVDSSMSSPIHHSPGQYFDAESRYSSDLRSKHFNVCWYFINQTGSDISVCDRSGLCVTVPSSTSIVNGDFIIRKHIHMEGITLQSALRSVSRLANSENIDAAELRAGLYKTKKVNFKNVSIQIDYTTPLEAITKHGGSVYNYQTDYILSTADVLEVPAHPYSTEYLDLSGFGRYTDFTNQQDLSIKVKYVSYDNRASKKFINVMGTVFVLTPQKQGPMRNLKIANGNKVPMSDYVQISYTSECAYGNTGKGMTTLTMCVKEAEVVLGMFDTYENAMAFGDPESRHKRNILELSQTLELLKSQNLLDKQKMDAESAAFQKAQFEREKDLESVKHQNNRLKSEIDSSSMYHAIELQKMKTDALAREALIAKSDHDRKILDDKLKQAEMERMRQDRLHDEQIRRDRALYDFNLSVAREAKRDKLTAIKDKRDAGIGLLKIIPAFIIGIGGIAAFLTKPPAKA